MTVGILSDTHDHLDRIRRALALFQERRVEALIHAGDVVAPFAARELKKWPGPFYVIYGNNDGERAGLAKVLPQIQDGPLSLTLDGRTFVVAHDLEQVPESAWTSADVVVVGHTHKPGSEMRGKAIVINPGETCGWVTGRASVAVLDTRTLKVEILELSGGSP